MSGYGKTGAGRRARGLAAFALSAALAVSMVPAEALVAPEAAWAAANLYINAPDVSGTYHRTNRTFVLGEANGTERLKPLLSNDLVSIVPGSIRWKIEKGNVLQIVKGGETSNEITVGPSGEEGFTLV